MAAELFPDFQVILVPGLHNSGPDHWQTLWHRDHPEFYRVEQAHWDRPDLAAWTARVDQVRALDPRPALIIAHSFGCLASVSSIARDGHDVAGALLVAPADPDKFGVASVLPAQRLNCATLMIGSANDPWMNLERAARWGARWGSEFINAGPLGHINADSQLGEWVWGQQQLRRLLQVARDGNVAISA
jgi:predicted alpha/beta hydrolase family esterase